MAAPGELVAVAEPIAREVADHLRESLAGAGPAVSTKTTATDLVTELDLWAEARITERLVDARPHDTVEGEEGAAVAGTSEVTWSVDPIDGTVNFVHGLPGFNVSIAAIVDERPVAGVVASVLPWEVFTAHEGGGAACNGTPIACATPASAAHAVVGTGFAYDPVRRTRQAEAVARAIGEIADVRRIGAAASDLCFVAMGRLDGFWEVGLNRWDLAAGTIVAREAGAKVAALDGAEPSGASTLAAPPAIWDELAEILLRAGATDL
ncbi:MAG: inositol monophosphatase [Acidimicrobiales bacterium]|nr:inositol monophosphatase [Acidimicrobiales bacterium]